MKWVRLAALVACAGLGAAGRAEAGLLKYTQTFVTSGTLGGQAFTDAVVTFSMIADTSTVTYVDATFPYYQTTEGFAAVSIDGPGVALSTWPSLVFASNYFQRAGFFGQRGGNFANLTATAFASYDLRTPIGPVTGTPFVLVDGRYATNRGFLTFTDFPSTSTFEAVAVTAVPEPSSLAMAGLGVLTLAGVSLRRRSA